MVMFIIVCMVKRSRSTNLNALSKGRSLLLKYYYCHGLLSRAQYIELSQIIMFAINTDHAFRFVDLDLLTMTFDLL